MIIKSKIRDYSAEFAETDEFIKGIVARPDHVFIIDNTVWDLYRETVLQEVPIDKTIFQPITEDFKNLESVNKLYDRLVNFQAKKNITLVVIGGGILQDICGYVASTLYRGVRWILMPTTLLAQADSCIGSKTSLNYKNYKNLIGTFYPPTEIFIYLQFLFTLSELDYFSGLGEIVKLHIMAGVQKIEEIRIKLPLLKKRDLSTLRSVIEESLQIKKAYIEEDEFDAGRRNLLNYGHCFGHAVETITNFEIPHGQAVVIGMMMANIVACERGLLSRKTCDFIYNELLLPCLFTYWRQLGFESDDLIQAMKKDKKRKGNCLALIMMDDCFNFISVNDLTEREAHKAITELRDANL